MLYKYVLGMHRAVPLWKDLEAVKRENKIQNQVKVFFHSTVRN